VIHHPATHTIHYFKGGYTHQQYLSQVANINQYLVLPQNFVCNVVVYLRENKHF